MKTPIRLGVALLCAGIISGIVAYVGHPRKLPPDGVKSIEWDVVYTKPNGDMVEAFRIGTTNSHGFFHTNIVYRWFRQPMGVYYETNGIKCKGVMVR